MHQFDYINTSLRSAVETIQMLQSTNSIHFIYQVAEMIAKAFQNGNKMLVAGNGGSLCDAMHFCEELTGFFRKKRKALPAISLSDPSYLTCVSNDTDFSEVFARGIEAYGKEGDIFVALSTSGNSENIVRAIYSAKSHKLLTIAFTGKDGGRIHNLCDFELLINSNCSARIQEAHMTVIHIIIEEIERRLFADTHYPAVAYETP